MGGVTTSAVQADESGRGRFLPGIPQIRGNQHNQILETGRDPAVRRTKGRQEVVPIGLGQLPSSLTPETVQRESAPQRCGTDRVPVNAGSPGAVARSKNEEKGHPVSQSMQPQAPSGRAALSHECLSSAKPIPAWVHDSRLTAGRSSQAVVRKTSPAKWFASNYPH